MTSSPNNLIWIDLEMTGLDTDNDYIIEVATIITDTQLNILAEGPIIAVYRDEEILLAMDEWNTRQHNQSGLVKRVMESPYSAADAESLTLEFIKKFVPEGVSPMCGNSICQDVGNNCRDLNDIIIVCIQTGHFQVNPDEIIR